MNVNKKHLFNQELIKYMFDKYVCENMDMYTKFDSKKTVIDIRNNNSRNNNARNNDARNNNDRNNNARNNNDRNKCRS